MKDTKQVAAELNRIFPNRTVEEIGRWPEVSIIADILDQDEAISFCFQATDGDYKGTLIAADRTLVFISRWGTRLRIWECYYGKLAEMHYIYGIVQGEFSFSFFAGGSLSLTNVPKEVIRDFSNFLREKGKTLMVTANTPS